MVKEVWEERFSVQVISPFPTAASNYALHVVEKGVLSSQIRRRGPGRRTRRTISTVLPHRVMEGGIQENKKAPSVTNLALRASVLEEVVAKQEKSVYFEVDKVVLREGVEAMTLDRLSLHVVQAVAGKHVSKTLHVENQDEVVVL